MMARACDYAVVARPRCSTHISLSHTQRHKDTETNAHELELAALQSSTAGADGRSICDNENYTAPFLLQILNPICVNLT